LVFGLAVHLRELATKGTEVTKWVLLNRLSVSFVLSVAIASLPSRGHCFGLAVHLRELATKGTEVTKRAF